MKKLFRKIKRKIKAFIKKVIGNTIYAITSITLPHHCNIIIYKILKRKRFL
jgi:hypothetical protein